jgi:hypothetical protein
MAQDIKFVKLVFTLLLGHKNVTNTKILLDITALNTTSSLKLFASSARVARSKKFNRSKSSFKKGQILKNEKTVDYGVNAMNQINFTSNFCL